MNLEEIPRRIVSERQRLGLSVAQLAVLVGITAEQQAAIEGGNLDARPFSYYHAMQRAGCDPQFLCGSSDAPKATKADLNFGDESFMDAVSLMRKSIQAVDAFVGEGGGARSPELVAALMNATIHTRYSPVGEGSLENFAETIANALYELGSQISEALGGDPEALEGNAEED